MSTHCNKDAQKTSRNNSPMFENAKKKKKQLMLQLAPPNSSGRSMRQPRKSEILVQITARLLTAGSMMADLC